jgi:hypothetical protein
MTGQWRAVAALKYLVRAIGLASAFAAMPLSASFGAAVIVGSHYEEWKQATCSNSNHCLLAMSPVPAGKYLIVTKLNCNSMNNSVSTSILGATFFGVGNLSSPVWIQFLSVYGPLRMHVIDAQTSKAFPQGTSPKIQVVFGATATASSLSCTIAGELH